MTALFEEVRESYGADRCAYPYALVIRESYSDGSRILICGKGAGSWGLQYAGIEGIGPWNLKSKYVNEGGSMWEAGGEERDEFIREALETRIKLATEATNVRAYVDAKFGQVANPAIFVMGDLNDGPGKELFEDRYLFFDLVSNVQGDVFWARRFLNHALFDFPGDLRWSVYFRDFVEPERDPRILIDHILFTQGLVDGSLLWKIEAHAGKVEHEVHDLINAMLPTSAKTSDHKPVSVMVTTDD